MRALLLMLVAFPVAAAELQFDVSGNAFDLQQFNPPAVPYSLSFDVDSLSGQQTYFFAGGCMQSVSLSGLAYNNFSMHVGTQTISSSTGRFDFGGRPPGPGCGIEYYMGLGPAGLIMTLYAVAPTSLGPPDPGASLLLGLPAARGSTYGSIDETWGLDVSKFKVKDVSVDEPQTLWLAALGFGLCALQCRRRRST